MPHIPLRFKGAISTKYIGTTPIIIYYFFLLSKLNLLLKIIIIIPEKTPQYTPTKNLPTIKHSYEWT